MNCRIRLNQLDIKTEADYKENKAETIKKTEESIRISKTEAEQLKKLKAEQETLKSQLKSLYDRFNLIQASNQELNNL